MRLERVTERMGIPGSISNDLDGLTQAYSAWCEHVPFDNVQKMIRLRTQPGSPLPGAHAEEFFDHFLDGGTGGTCWSSANALCELLQDLGFNARRAAGSMFDGEAVNHGTVKVALPHAGDWLVDTFMLHHQPVPLTDQDFIGKDIEAEWDNGTHLIWTHPPNMGPMPCRLREDHVDHAFYLGKYEFSREVSPFNQRLCARRNRAGHNVMLVGSARYVKTTEGTEKSELSEAELLRAMQVDIGISGQVVHEWVEAGCLASSMEPSTAMKWPDVVRQPPSRKA